MSNKREYSEFQFTHPVWGATDTPELGELSLVVSIHAPRVGCDPGRLREEQGITVSIHAPRVGCDRQRLF